MRVLFNFALCMACVFAFMFSTQANAQEQGALGIAIAQGYDYPYISHINPFGAGAASGLMVGDHIKEIGAASVWYTYQAEAFLKNQKAGQPFTMVIERNGTLHSLNIDVRRPMRKWLNIDPQGEKAKCFFRPSVECIKSYTDVAMEDTLDQRYSGYYSAVKTLALAGMKAEAVTYAINMEKDFYSLPEFFSFQVGTLLETLALVDRKPSDALVPFVLRNIRQDNLSDYLSVASSFEKYGHADQGRVFFDRAMALIKKDPSKLRFSARSFGEALAAYGEYEQIKTYAQSSEYKSDWAVDLLEGAITQHIKEGDLKSVDKVLQILFTINRGWSDKEYVQLIQLFMRLHQPETAERFLSILERNYNKNESNNIARALYAGSLVRGNAAMGRIAEAQTYLNRHFENSVRMKMDLIIHAVESKSSYGIGVQFYKDLPPLIEETHRLYLALPDKEKKRARGSDMRKFYSVLAAYLNINPDYRDFSAQNIEKFSYERVIDSQIQVRKLDQALVWTDYVQKKFGKTYKYGKIFSSLGSSGSQKAIDSFSKHPKFAEYRQRFLRHHMYRLFWNGRVKDAAVYFNSLDEKEKIGAIRRQVYFVRTCAECDL